MSEEHDWGLIDRDPDDGHLMGFEIWEATRNLPPELVDALPAPGSASSAAQSLVCGRSSAPPAQRRLFSAPPAFAAVTGATCGKPSKREGHPVPSRLQRSSGARSELWG